MLIFFRNHNFFIKSQENSESFYILLHLFIKEFPTKLSNTSKNHTFTSLQAEIVSFLLNNE